MEWLGNLDFLDAIIILISSSVIFFIGWWSGFTIGENKGMQKAVSVFHVTYANQILKGRVDPSISGFKPGIEELQRKERREALAQTPTGIIHFEDCEEK